jgi:acid phosphatase (class A)
MKKDKMKKDKQTNPYYDLNMNTNLTSQQSERIPNSLHQTPVSPMNDRFYGRVPGRWRILFLHVAVGLVLATAAPGDVQTNQAPAGAYVSAGEFDLRALLPDPPADDSPATRAEIEELLKLQAARTPEQVARVEAEDTVNVYAFFTSVLGTNFAAARLPVTDGFLNRVGSQVSAISGRSKNIWKRARPFDVDKRLEPVGRKPVSKSYPSGHTVRAFAWAMVLGELFPAKKAELLERAKEIGLDRMIAGVHYPSDVEAGTKLGKAIGEKLIASAAFQKDAETVRQEIETVLTKK